MSKDGSNDLFLEAGESSFPFKVALPPNCPSSYHHSMGNIGYSIKGTIDIPWSFDKHTEKSFTIINIVDLNRCNPNIRLPREVKDNKNVTFSTGGLIEASFKLEKSKYLFYLKNKNTLNSWYLCHSIKSKK